MDWTKRRGTAAKRIMNPALYDELPFSWKKDIANLILQHNIPEELILNLDQHPTGVYSKKVPMSNIDDKG